MIKKIKKLRKELGLDNQVYDVLDIHLMNHESIDEIMEGINACENNDKYPKDKIEKYLKARKKSIILDESLKLLSELALVGIASVAAYNIGRCSKLADKLYKLGRKSGANEVMNDILATTKRSPDGEYRVRHTNADGSYTYIVAKSQDDKPSTWIDGQAYPIID